MTADRSACSTFWSISSLEDDDGYSSVNEQLCPSVENSKCARSELPRMALTCSAIDESAFPPDWRRLWRTRIRISSLCRCPFPGNIGFVVKLDIVDHFLDLVKGLTNNILFVVSIFVRHHFFPSRTLLCIGGVAVRPVVIAVISTEGVPRGLLFDSTGSLTNLWP